LPKDARADEIIVLKSKRKLVLMAGGQAVKSYNISLGGDPIGQKVQRGDGRTPEGMFYVDQRIPTTAYHAALHISYPRVQDRALAESQGASADEEIMIQGIRRGFGWLGRYHRLTNWTNGSIALTNSEIDEIYRAVSDGVQVEIRP
jgi:murein L,D-transpeptidase YafK